MILCKDENGGYRSRSVKLVGREPDIDLKADSMTSTAELSGCSPRTVLMTSDTIGGVWTYSLDLAHELGRLGVHVALATMGKPLSHEQAAEAAKVANLTVYESTFKLEWMDDPWAEVDTAGEWLVELEGGIAPDMIHLNGYAHASLPWNAPKLVVAHSCVLSWWRAVKGGTPPEAWTTYRRRVTDGLRNADCVIAPTRAMLEAVEENYGELERSGVIANGRDLKVFRPAEKENIVLTAGRLWDEAKNVGAVLNAASSMPWQFYVAGDGIGPQTDAVGSNTSESIHFLGRLSTSEVAELYARAAVYVMPAKYEPFGLSILEAAASGCALVLGDIKSLRENWEGAAVFADPQDPTALSSTIEQVMNDGDLRSRLSVAALRRASRFPSSKMAESYHSLYAELLANKARSSQVRKEGVVCA